MCVCVCVCVCLWMSWNQITFSSSTLVFFFFPHLSALTYLLHTCSCSLVHFYFLSSSHLISKLQRRRACHKQRRDFACGNMLVFKVSSAASLLHNTQSQSLHISAMYDMLFKITTQFKTSFKHTTYLYINQTAGGCVTGAAEMSYSQSSLRLAGRQRWYWSV